MPQNAVPASVGAPQITLVPQGAECLSLREWWCHVGTENFNKVVQEMGTSELYMRHLAYRYRLPSYRFAKALIAAAHIHTPGFAPHLERLLEPVTPRRGPPGVRGPSIKPSAQFCAHQRYLQAIARGDVPQAISPQEADDLLARLERAAKEHQEVLSLIVQRGASQVSAAAGQERAA